MRKEAIELLERADGEMRSEERRQIEYILPIVLGVFGAVIASFSSHFVLERLLCFSWILEVGIAMLVLSFVSSILYFSFETSYYQGNIFFRGLQKMDQADALTKDTLEQRKVFEAIVELVTRRNVHGRADEVSEEARERFSGTLDGQKANLHSWKDMKDPKSFYCGRHRTFVRLFYWASLVTAVSGMLILSLIYMSIV